MLRVTLLVTALSASAVACGSPKAPATADASTEPQAPELNEANHRAAAIQLLERMHMDKLFDTIIEASVSSAMQIAPKSEAMTTAMREFMREILDPDAMMAEFVTIYTRHFTQRELETLVAFYSTDLGKKLIEKMPELAREGAELGQRRVRERMPELIAKMQAKIRE
jgi:hypothetical protein